MDKPYKIGYTTGVFDLFHIGHLNILRQAKERCGRLIVGVSTDELVEEYKHKRPIVPFEERLAIVAAIRYVDEVIPQTNMDKIAAWKDIQFDVMFHGDDWKGSALYREYEERFAALGVDVVYFPHTRGVSSSKLQDFLLKIDRSQKGKE